LVFARRPFDIELPTVRAVERTRSSQSLPVTLKVLIVQDQETVELKSPTAVTGVSASEYLSALVAADPVRGNAYDILANGDEVFPAMLDAIKKARERVRFETYAAGLYLDDLDLDNGVVYVRRSILNGQELEPKVENVVREIDVDSALVELLRDVRSSPRSGCSRHEPAHRCRLATSAIGCCIRSWRNSRFPKPDCTFRHSRVTLLRGTPGDLQKLWIGHSSLRTTDRYAHTDQELEYRPHAAARVGLDLIVGPNLSSWTQSTSEGEGAAKTSA
jgi:integrase